MDRRKHTKKDLPLVLQLAAERIGDLFQLADLTHGSERCRAMRRERREAISKVVLAILSRLCLQASGIIVQLEADGREASPLSVESLAAVAGLPARRTKRALYDLRIAGLLEVKQQWRRSPDHGRTLLVAACVRRLTRRFWAALNLWGLFIETVRYMQGRPAIRIKTAIYRISASLKGKKLTPLMENGQPKYYQETPEEKKRRKQRQAAFRCLMNNGGPCDSPSCSLAQLAVCKQVCVRIFPRDT